jgi:hypothetical protein
MDAWLSPGTIQMSGRETGLREEGSLKIAQPRTLLVAYPHRGAYDSNGKAVRETQRLWNLGHGECPDPVPDLLPTENVVEQRDDEVVWGGFYTFHYGHFLTESVARLWPLLPKGALEGLPVVFATSERSPFITEWEHAFGIEVVEPPLDGAVRFSRMHVPEPAWRLSAWIAPEIRDIHLHARNRLDVPSLSQGEVLWLSRTRVELGRRVRDEALCQWLLGDRVRVVHPQELTLVDQIAEVESCAGMVGPVGSAFHTLLMARRMPRCLYLAPSRTASSFVAQDALLNARDTFVHALANDQMAPETQDRHPFRLLVPETLRALASTILPDLLDDERLARIAYLERWWSTVTDRAPREPDLDTLIARVLVDPYRLDARMDLGARFEEEGVIDCALEQFSTVADLADGYAYAPLRAARILNRVGRFEEGSTFAKRVLKLEPTSDEAQGYVELGPGVQ